MSRQRQVAAIRGTIFDLTNRGCEFRVAYLVGRPEFLFGFVCYETGHPYPLVHYVYIKKDYRENGIGRGLVDVAREGIDGQVRYSHRTKLGEHLFKGGFYTPALARYEERPRRNPAAANQSY